jgi:hypothetical protein
VILARSVLAKSGRLISHLLAEGVQHKRAAV